MRTLEELERLREAAEDKLAFWASLSSDEFTLLRDHLTQRRQDRFG